MTYATNKLLKMYDGQWKDGKREGNASYTMRNGKSYSGTWRNDVIVQGASRLLSADDGTTHGWGVQSPKADADDQIEVGPEQSGSEKSYDPAKSEGSYDPEAHLYSSDEDEATVFYDGNGKYQA